MTFVQVIEFKAENLDGVRALEAEWEKATEGKRTARRSVLTTDRNDPTRHLVLVTFDSYESAMENSALPETQAFAEGMVKLAQGPMSFHDLDVVDDLEL
jgi:quinol monooxygenase YgiN